MTLYLTRGSFDAHGSPCEDRTDYARYRIEREDGEIVAAWLETSPGCWDPVPLRWLPALLGPVDAERAELFAALEEDERLLGVA